MSDSKIIIQTDAAWCLCHDYWVTVSMIMHRDLPTVINGYTAEECGYVRHNLPPDPSEAVYRVVDCPLFMYWYMRDR